MDKLGFISSHFFKGNWVLVTVTSGRWIEMLNMVFLSALRRSRIACCLLWFQRIRTTSYPARVNGCSFQTSRFGDIAWPLSIPKFVSLRLLSMGVPQVACPPHLEAHTLNEGINNLLTKRGEAIFCIHLDQCVWANNCTMPEINFGTRRYTIWCF